ncbi:hypothetical protein C2845_PM11G17980 [Panicum miliaceum]|uniref:Uncharacterized protein n=1 Tax=Panicum miliaceum TaxID=4540 RepID=A0A3L6RVD7_PANMI|nr:hypothetical protein C2845_PM11G17980 [Panicum miliaceum]
MSQRSSVTAVLRMSQRWSKLSADFLGPSAASSSPDNGAQQSRRHQTPGKRRPNSRGCARRKPSKASAPPPAGFPRTSADASRRRLPAPPCLGSSRARRATPCRRTFFPLVPFARHRFPPLLLPPPPPPLPPHLAGSRQPLQRASASADLVRLAGAAASRVPTMAGRRRMKSRVHHHQGRLEVRPVTRLRPSGSDRNRLFYEMKACRRIGGTKDY